MEEINKERYEDVMSEKGGLWTHILINKVAYQVA